MAKRGEGLAIAMREVAAARCLDVDELACRLFTVSYLRGEAGCAGDPFCEVELEPERLDALGDDLSEEELALAIEQGARDRASFFWRLYGLAHQSGRVADWRLVFERWQAILEAAPAGRPLWRNLTATHQLLADKLEQIGDPGEQWRTVLLPCRECGCVFESRRRGGRYRRGCCKCRPALGIRLLDRPHPRSRGLQRGHAIYSYCRPELPKLERAAVVDSFECAHPGCDVPVVWHRSDRDYCDEHIDAAASQRRHRLRAAA